MHTPDLISLLGLELKGLGTTGVECYDFDANIKCPMANCYSSSVLLKYKLAMHLRMLWATLYVFLH